MIEKLSIMGDFSRKINFSMHQNSVPIIKRLFIKNQSSESFKNIKVCIATEPNFSEEWSAHHSIINPEETLELNTINLLLKPTFLYGITETIKGYIKITIHSGEELIKSEVIPISLLAYDEWPGVNQMPELISSFITPNHPTIAKIIMNATHILKEWKYDPAFTGYQTLNPNIVRIQMAALYGALQQVGIVYTMPPASFETKGQRIRLPDSVLNEKLGTCLDLSVLYASCLEAVGLHPLIIFIKGHAFVGCWLEEESFSEIIQDECSVVKKRIAQGIDEICVVETTELVVGRQTSFDLAVLNGEKNLINEENFEILVDVKRVRVSGIKPLPQRIYDNDGKLRIDDSIIQKQHDEDFITSKPAILDIKDKLQYVEHINLSKKELWERKLLDLSLRNTLLNFRTTKNTIELMLPSLREVEDYLSDGSDFILLAKPKEFDNTQRDTKLYEANHSNSFILELLKSELKEKRIRTYIDNMELDNRILSLYRASKISLEENGVNTLYLALGFLRWYESNESQKPRLAPLILLPIELVRKSALKGYVIRVRDEEPQINITLLELLRSDFGITISGLEPLPMDDKGLDISRIFSTIRQAIMSKAKWDIVEISYIGLFSFSQFIMWNDIRNRGNELVKNKIVQSLLSGKVEWEVRNDFPNPNTLDEEFKPTDLAIPISADSTQLSAICAASKGESFVLHGPPGTGKSQTITNMIANALFEGKSVLFIAEKMAALSVVQKRLESIGLGPFCLEVHSNKARKKDVLEQLNQTLNYGKVKSKEEYELNANRLQGLRSELNEFVTELHKKRSYGISLYEAIAKAEEYEDYSNKIRIPRELLSNLNKFTFNEWLDVCEELRVVGEASGGIYEHPLKHINNPYYTTSKKSSFEEKTTEFITVLKQLKMYLDEFYEDFGADRIEDFNKVEATFVLCNLYSSIKYIPANLYFTQEINILKDKIQLIYESAKKRNEIEEILSPIFNDSIYSYDVISAARLLQEAERSWFLPKFLKKNKIIKELKYHVKDSLKFDKQSIVNYINSLIIYREKNNTVMKDNDLLTNLYGVFWDNSHCDLEEYLRIYEQCVVINQFILKVFDNGTSRKDGKEKLYHIAFNDMEAYLHRQEALIHKIINGFKQIKTLEQNLSDEFGIDFNLLHGNNYFQNMEKTLRDWKENSSNLRDYCSYLNSKKKAQELGLHVVIEALESGTCHENVIVATFIRNSMEALASMIIEQTPVLSQFNGMYFEQMVIKFKTISEEFDNLTKQELVARLSAKVPSSHGTFTASSEIGILQKAIKSGGRGMSIRKLFDSIPNLLQLLCPCMLMSPISVAQYIDPSYPPFDLVIFDEASQLPTAQAVGAIARGENLVVVGDPKQLPPTSFFSSNRVDEDNYDNEDLESILDDCLAISMPQEHLLWHYRSKHESLIAFSNRMFYENRLYTFPSPKDLVSEVKHVLVEGYYDKSKSRTNLFEATAVVNEIIRRLKEPKLCHESIGVVTFSKAQQNLIDDLLMKEFAKDPILEERNNSLSEPIFIKNLENVQGDERDVIMFSICYGPDKDGAVSMNFGPLNQEGGFRRLNVAVTRSRKEMIVYSVLKPEQIDLQRTNSSGVAALKSFLEFAMRGNLTTKQSNITKPPTNISRIIASKLIELGFDANVNIGSSEFKIDIAIVNPKKKEEYILGILLDSDSQCNGTARDRNILKLSVLQSLGWNIHKVWILDWWDNKHKVLDMIQFAIQQAILKLEIDNTSENDSNMTIVENKPFEFEQETRGVNDLNEDITYYQSVLLPSVSLSSEGFYSSENDRIIMKQIMDIMECEAPIGRMVLCKKILSSWGITRLGANINRRFDMLFSKMKIKLTMEEEENFCWLPTMNPNNYKEFRMPSNDETKRRVEDIPLEEIGAALVYVVKKQISLSEEDLYREVARVFGYSRCLSNMKERFTKALEKEVKKENLVLEKDRVYLKV